MERTASGCDIGSPLFFFLLLQQSTGLRIRHLENNFISGTLPLGWGSMSLALLYFLFLSFSFFPTMFHAFLRRTLQTNSLTGALPSEWSNLGYLQLYRPSSFFAFQSQKHTPMSLCDTATFEWTTWLDHFRWSGISLFLGKSGQKLLFVSFPFYWGWFLFRSFLAGNYFECGEASNYSSIASMTDYATWQAECS